MCKCIKSVNEEINAPFPLMWHTIIIENTNSQTDCKKRFMG